jgi:integrase
MQYLNDTKVKQAKQRERPFKLTDGGGLYLHIAANGSKFWRYQYRFNARAKLMALGVYPDVSLGQARERHKEARKLLADSKDPMADRKEQRQTHDANAITFEAVFKLWFVWWKEGKAEKHSAQVERRVLADIIPVFGSKPIDDVTAADVRDMMLAIAKRGAKDVARRSHETTSQVFRYAIAHGHAKRNPAADFKPSDIVIKLETQNFARVDAKELPVLLAAMDGYNGTGITKLAMRLLALTFVRTSELIEAEWAEFDLDSARWDIPKERMKMDTPHIVPLSRQAVDVLRALQMLTGKGRLLFPGDLDKSKPMSNNTILKALERMGYKGVMTGHGWRGIATTVLYENGYKEEHVEVQLAHLKRNKVRASYDHAKYLPQRKKMMQWWANYLEKRWNTPTPSSGPRQ